MGRGYEIRGCPLYLQDERQEPYNPGARRPGQPVVGYCLKTGERKRWESMKQAEKLGGFQTYNIRACCNGKQASHKGWVFFWAEKEDSG